MNNKNDEELEYLLYAVSEKLLCEPNEVAGQLGYDGRPQGGSGKACIRAQGGIGKS